MISVDMKTDVKQEMVAVFYNISQKYLLKIESTL